MKASAGKDNSTPSLSSNPVFAKKGEESFFTQTNEAEQPFFAPGIFRQVGGDYHTPHKPFFQAKSQPVIQAKLTINEPGDQYEQEADAMADRVMRMTSAPPAGDGALLQTGFSTAPSLQRKCATCEEEEKIQREEMDEEEPLQRKEISTGGFGGSEPIVIQRKCATCEEVEKVQRQEMEEEEPVRTKSLMRKADGGGYTASPQLSSQLNSSKGGGDPLPSKALGFMNQAFGADFSHVRIHTDSRSAEMSQGIQAKAFTHGSDIYFNRGQYSPESSEGRRLLGHELTHVVQQEQLSGLSSLQRKCNEEVKKEYDREAYPCLGPGESFSSLYSDNNIFKFQHGCDDYLPGEEEKLKREAAGRISMMTLGSKIQIHGFASKDGSADLNWKLSCQRARRVQKSLLEISYEFFKAHDKPLINGTPWTYMHGGISGSGQDAQSVIVKGFQKNVQKSGPPAPSIDPTAEKLIVWINAFIPGSIPSVTKVIKSGNHSGKTMVEGPPLSNCYLTDNRGFSSIKNASARMMQGFVVSLNNNKVQEIHFTNPTHEINCDNGSEICTSVANASYWHMVYDTALFVINDRTHISEPNEQPVSIEFSGSGSNPCVTLPSGKQVPESLVPAIDFNGQIVIYPKSRRLFFKGLVDAFPAYEMYAASTIHAQPWTIFQQMPAPGNTPLDLVGNASEPVSGSLKF